VPPLSIGRLAALACLLEVAAPKPGNVHGGARFAATTQQDFLVSAEVLSQVVDRAAELRVGELILQAVSSTKAWVGQNTNLGLILLLAPLAKAAIASEGITARSVQSVLDDLTPTDSKEVFLAIDLAAPGGLGRVSTYDVREDAPDSLLSAMAAAADRDSIAREYVSEFVTVREEVAAWIVEGYRAGWSLADAVVHAHLRTMAQYPDSLIGRKAGPEVAKESANRAAAVLQQRTPEQPAFQTALGEFDRWLRAEGNVRNPGTSADLIGAGLFVALVNRGLSPPLR
jgi:triphosphoribosyl-dephospho-CoA synthase